MEGLGWGIGSQILHHNQLIDSLEAPANDQM